MYFPLRKYMPGLHTASRARPVAARAGHDVAVESICATCGAEPEPHRRCARSALTGGSTFPRGGRSRGDRCGDVLAQAGVDPAGYLTVGVGQTLARMAEGG